MNRRSSERAMKGTCYQYRGLAKDTVQDLTGPAQVQNVKAARVYVFGDADVDEEEILNDEAEKHELRCRGKSKSNKADENSMLTIERPILEGETLQKIAVKYSCEVSELKRINNLLTDQDFFALTCIKVPVRKYDLKREELEKEIRENANSLGVGGINGSAVALSAAPDGDLVLELMETDEERSETGSDVNVNEPLVKTVSIKGSLGNQSLEAQRFLHRMDADIKNILSSTKSSRKKNLEDVRHSLICRRIYPMNHKEGYLGADCGMKLGTVIAIIVIVAIVTPLVYYLYYNNILNAQTPHQVNQDGDGS